MSGYGAPTPSTPEENHHQENDMQSSTPREDSTDPNATAELRPVERRRHERRTLEAEIGVYSETNFYTGFSEDISEGGMFVATYDLRPIGAQVDLEFVLPGGYEVSVRGEVRWVKDPIDSDSFAGMGIRFLDLKGEDLAAVQEFVSNREPLFHA